MTDIVADMIEVLTSSITTGVTQVASGIKTGLQTIFIDTASGGTQSLSVAGYLILGFAGIGLALGIARICVNWVAGLGGGNF